MTKIIETAVFVADVVLTSLCYYAYKKCLQRYKVVEATDETYIDQSLISLVANSPGELLPYVCVSGFVSPVRDDQVLVSQYKPGILGVIQKLFTIEHKTQRVHGYWTDTQRLVRNSVNVVPFAISSGANDVRVHVTEPLEARFVMNNLTVVHDEFKARTGSMVFDRIFGDVSKGFSDTEKMLKVGAGVLAFGRLILDRKGPADVVCLNLQPPDDRGYFIITTLPRSELLRSLYSEVSFYRVLTVIFACAGVVIVYINFANYHEQRRREARYNAPIRAARGRRHLVQLASNLRHLSDATADLLNCVICLNQRREIVVLNCGHICMCADCAELLPQPRRCPICRGHIERFILTYNS